MPETVEHKNIRLKKEFLLEDNTVVDVVNEDGPVSNCGICLFDGYILDFNFLETITKFSD